MNKKVIGIVIAVVVVVLLAIAGYIAMGGVRQEATLRQEAEKLSKIDITKDNVDMEIKTKGDYAVVEKTMKEYINKYAITIKELGSLLEDEKIAEVLTAENYKNDGPEFIQTKEYLSQTKSSFNEKINILIEMTSEDAMMKAIEEKGLNQEYIDLYKELMLGDEITEDLNDALESLKEASQTINKVLDVQDKVIDLLIANNNKWQISDKGEIEFYTQALVDEYNGYLAEIQ